MSFSFKDGCYKRKMHSGTAIIIGVERKQKIEIDDVGIKWK